MYVLYEHVAVRLSGAGALMQKLVRGAILIVRGGGGEATTNSCYWWHRLFSASLAWRPHLLVNKKHPAFYRGTFAKRRHRHGFPRRRGG